MKVALIREAEVGRHRGNLLAIAQTPLRLFQPKVQVIAVQRQAVLRLELPRELEPAHRRDGRELGGGHVLIEARVQVVADPLERLLGATRRR